MIILLVAVLPLLLMLCVRIRNDKKKHPKIEPASKKRMAKSEPAQSTVAQTALPPTPIAQPPPPPPPVAPAVSKDPLAVKAEPPAPIVSEKVVLDSKPVSKYVCEEFNRTVKIDVNKVNENERKVEKVVVPLETPKINQEPLDTHKKVDNQESKIRNRRKENTSVRQEPPVLELTAISDRALSRSMITCQSECEFNETIKHLIGNVDENIGEYDEEHYLKDRLVTDQTLTCLSNTDPKRTPIFDCDYEVWLADKIGSQAETN